MCSRFAASGLFFFFQAEDGIRDKLVTGVQTCALPILTLPIASALELGAIGRLTSGAPFTPVVGSDINGDGARNDRAFIFVPATAPDKIGRASCRERV